MAYRILLHAALNEWIAVRLEILDANMQILVRCLAPSAGENDPFSGEDTPSARPLVRSFPGFSATRWYDSVSVAHDYISV